jgi:hypothetical protein
MSPDLAARDQLDELRKVATRRSRAAVLAHVREQLLRIELDVVRDADVAHVAARPSGADGLLHRLPGPDALEH